MRCVHECADAVQRRRDARRHAAAVRKVGPASHSFQWQLIRARPGRRCNQQGIRCVYLALRKPGPKTGDSASRRADTRTLLLNDVVPDAPSRVDAAWASASDGSSASDSVPGQSPQVIDRTASLDFGQFARALFPHGANGVFASADPSRIAPDSRSGTFAPASRPDSFQRPVPFYGEFLVPDDVYSFLLHRYWTHFYHSTPAIVRRGIMNRVGRLQMFVNDACCFHTAFYLNSDDTFRFVPVFFERVKRGLVPAIERILGGQDMLSLPDYAVMSNGTRQLSIFVVFSLISIISVCMAEKATSDDPLGDAHALLTLAVRVARIAGMNAEWRFGRPETGKATPLLEMCRRCWWALFSIDRHISVLFGRAPLIHPDESEVAFPLSDADYEGLAKPEQENDALDLLLTESVTVSRPRGSKPPKIPWLTAPDKVTGSLGALPFGLVEYYVALMSLYERVRWYRALSLQANMPPWADTTARRFIVADLDTWFDGLPPFIEQYDGNPQLVVRGPNSGEMAAFAIGSVLPRGLDGCCVANPAPSTLHLDIDS